MEVLQIRLKLKLKLTKRICFSKIIRSKVICVHLTFETTSHKTKKKRELPFLSAFEPLRRPHEDKSENPRPVFYFAANLHKTLRLNNYRRTKNYVYAIFRMFESLFLLSLSQLNASIWSCVNHTF